MASTPVPRVAVINRTLAVMLNDVPIADHDGKELLYAYRCGYERDGVIGKIGIWIKIWHQYEVPYHSLTDANKEIVWQIILQYG